MRLLTGVLPSPSSISYQLIKYIFFVCSKKYLDNFSLKDNKIEVYFLSEDNIEVHERL